MSLNEVLRTALIREAEGTDVPEHELHLFARDAHFDHLPQIPRL